MAEQAALDDAKRKFASAKKNWVEWKGQVEKSYSQDLETGMISSRTTFSQWWPENHPQLAQATQRLLRDNAQVTARAGHIYGQENVWDHLEKKEYNLIQENVAGRERMEGILF